MLKAYKYRIYPNEEQEVLMAKHFGCVRLMYNIGLEYRQTAWKYGVSTNYNTTANELKLLKKDYEWLKEVNSQSLQKSLADLDTAFGRFFKKLGGYPNFKDKHKKQSFHCPQNVNIILSKGKLFLPKFKEAIEVEVHRMFKGEVRSCTVSRVPSGKYFVSILVENNVKLLVKKPITEETTVGLDLGIKHLIITSDGVKYDNPKHLRESLVHLKWLQRKLSKKTDYKSVRRKKLVKKLAKAHEKVANQRKDFLHKASHTITKQSDTICLESLKVKNMVQNHNLALSISDAGWGMFKGFVRYKSEFRGKNLLEIGTFEPSSKTCSCCGYINKDLTLKDREWACPSCGTVLDRDDNAAKNIKVFALKNWRVECSLQDAEVSPLSQGKRAVEALKVQNNMMQIAS